MTRADFRVDMLPVAWEDAMAALEQTGGTEGTAIASTGTGAGGAVGWGGRAFKYPGCL